MNAPANPFRLFDHFQPLHVVASVRYGLIGVVMCTNASFSDALTAAIRRGNNCSR